MVSVSAVITFRNCIQTGYPFMEAILSVLPLVDEYLVNDGGSTDGTREYVQRLTKTFPDKILLYDMKDYKSDRWDCVSDQYNVMIEDAVGDWIFQGDADEILHENDLETFTFLLENLSNEVDVLQHPRRELKSWTDLSSGRPYHPCRTARNISGLHQKWPSHGGDEFLDEKGWIHEPPRRKIVDIMVWHLYVVFPGNMLAKRENDALFIAPSDRFRAQIYETWGERKMRDWDAKIENPLPGLPALTKGMVGWGKYRVREELFNKDWLSSVTGLSYV